MSFQSKLEDIISKHPKTSGFVTWGMLQIGSSHEHIIKGLGNIIPKQPMDFYADILLPLVVGVGTYLYAKSINNRNKTIINLDELKKVQEELVQSKEEKESILRDLPVAAYKTSIDNGALLYANPKLAELLGYDDPSEIEGKKVIDFYVNPNDRINLLSDSDEDVGTHEFKLKRKDDSEFTAKINIKKVINSEGKLICYEGIIQDITKLKELENIKEESIRGERHNFRNPLGTIHNYTQLILEEYEELTPKEIKDFLSTIFETSKAMIFMVNHSLDLASMEHSNYQLNPNKFSIKSTLESAIKSLEYKAKENDVSIEYQLSPRTNSESLKTFSGEEYRIRTLFLNLIGNAVEASKEEDKVKIKVDEKKDDLLFEIYNPAIVPEKLREDFFGKFKTTNTTGLGTYHSKLIVEAHKGQINMKTGYDGTTISFNLPKYLKPVSVIKNK